MNKSALLILLLLLINSKAKGQEAFLSLDSIIVIEKELNFTTSSSYYNNGRDTVNLQIGENQYVKLRKVSFSFRSTSPLIFSGEYLDFTIGTELNLFIDLASSMLKWSAPSLSSASNFRPDYLDPKSIKIESFPDEFLTKSQEIIVAYNNRISTSHNVYYRLELVYYSHE